MNEPLIPGGYILLSRKLIESEIWKKPPLYLKVWIYLLSKAQHKEYKNLKRGQLWTTYHDIMEDCSWMVGARKEKPSKSQIFNILEWMRSPCSESNAESNTESNSKATANETMITTAKATRGILITIENFNVYQDSKNYESNSESNSESNDENSPKATPNRNRINKNDNKNDNISIYSIFDSYSENLDLRQALRDYSLMRNKIKAPLTERAASMLLNKLDALASTDELKIKIINEAILGNWKSVYPLKEDKPKQISKVVKPNKFHNFTPNDEYTGDDLEAIARKRFEEKVKRLKEKVGGN